MQRFLFQEAVLMQNQNILAVERGILRVFSFTGRVNSPNENNKVNIPYLQQEASHFRLYKKLSLY